MDDAGKIPALTISFSTQMADAEQNRALTTSTLESTVDVLTISARDTFTFKQMEDADRTPVAPTIILMWMGGASRRLADHIGIET